MYIRKWIIISVVLLIVAGAGIIWWQFSSSQSTSSQLQSRSQPTTSSPSPDDNRAAGGLIPDLDVVALDISNIDKDQVDGTARINFKNPLPVEIKTSGIDYEIFIDSVRVVRDAYNRPFKIGASDSAVIQVPVKILKDPMDRILEYFEKHKIDSATYTINMTANLDEPIEGEGKLDFQFSKEMPALRLPEIEMENFDPNIFSDTGMDLVLRITNPNIFDISISNGYFSFIVHDEVEMIGNVEDRIYIPAFESEEVFVSTRKKWGSLTQTGLNLLFDQEGTTFNYHFGFVLNSQNDLLNNIKMRINVNGTLDELTNAL